MSLEEFLKCEHDIDMDTSMTRLYCMKCGQDANVINYVKSLQSQLSIANKVIEVLEKSNGFYANKENWYEADLIEARTINDRGAITTRDYEYVDNFTSSAGKLARQALAEVEKIRNGGEV